MSVFWTVVYGITNKLLYGGKFRNITYSVGVVFFTGHLDTFLLFHWGRSNAGFNTRSDQENSSYCASTMIGQQKLFQGFSLVTSCQGVRAEEVWAADHGEYNDAKNTPSLQVVLLYLYPANNPSTPPSLKHFLVCAFAFSNFNSHSSGQEITWIFPQAELKPTRDPALLVL